MKLLIIRHGDPDYAHDTLTERGWEEAGLLCERLMKTENVTHVYLSPLGRARATAKPYLEATGKSAEVLDWLREFPRSVTQPLARLGLGAEDTRTCPWDVDNRVFEADAQRLSDPWRWQENPMYLTDGAAEYARTVEAGFDELLARHGLWVKGAYYVPGEDYEAHKNDTVALFCHMGLGSFLLAHLARMAPSQFWQFFRFMPTSVSTVLFGERAPGVIRSTIFAVGDTAHLAPIGLTWRG